MEPGAQANRWLARPRHDPLLHLIGASHERDALGGVGELVLRPVAGRVGLLRDEASGDQAALSGGKLERDAIGEGMITDQGIPSAAAGQIAAGDVRHGRQVLQRAAVVGFGQSRQGPGVTQHETVHRAAAQLEPPYLHLAFPAGRLGEGLAVEREVLDDKIAAQGEPGGAASLKCDLRPAAQRSRGRVQLDVQVLMHRRDAIRLGRHGGAKRQSHHRGYQPAAHCRGGKRATSSSDSSPRFIVMGSQVPGACCRTASVMSPASCTGTPAIVTITSPVWTPARSAMLSLTYLANHHAAAAAVQHHTQPRASWSGRGGCRQAEHCVRQAGGERAAIDDRRPMEAARRPVRSPDRAAGVARRSRSPGVRCP